MQTLIQIGSNNGDDDFNRYVNSIPDKCEIYLFEPNIHLLNDLKKSYNNSHHNIYIQNMCVTPTPIDSVELHLYDQNGLSSVLDRKSYNNKTGSINVDAITFNKFCEDKKIDRINYLCIDTEGLDYEILLSINLDTIEIDEILFEVWPYENDDNNGSYSTGPTLLNKVFEKYRDYAKDQIVYGGALSYNFKKIIC